MTEDIEKGRENDELTLKSKQACTILEDYKYLLLAGDDKGFAASANYDTPDDLVKLLMEFATKHPPMLEALLIINKVINTAIKDTLENETSASSKP